MTRERQEALPPEDWRIQAIIDGRRDAAESLLAELLPRVRNLVRYLVRGDHDVDDIAQDALIAILKGLPIGYNRDLQEDKRIVFRAYDTVSQCLTMAAAIVKSASFDKDRIEPTLDRGFLDATSLAEYLVTKEIPFRTAHHIVGTLVARCEKEGKHALSQLSMDAFNAGT